MVNEIKDERSNFLPKYTGGLFKLNSNFIALSEEAFACQQHLDHWAHVACLELLMGRQGRQRRLMLIIPTCHNVRTTQYHSIPQHQYSTIALYPLYPTTNITLCHNINIPIYYNTTLCHNATTMLTIAKHTSIPLKQLPPQSCDRTPVKNTFFHPSVQNSWERDKKSEDVDFRKTFDISFRGCNATKTSR